MNNMADMFGKVTEFQERMNAELSQVEVNAEAGGGMVKVKANGRREIISIELDPDIIDKNDKEMLEDLVVAGVNKAMAEADRAAQTKQQSLLKEMLPGGGIPGLDLGNMFG